MSNYQEIKERLSELIAEAKELSEELAVYKDSMKCRPEQRTVDSVFQCPKCGWKIMQYDIPIDSEQDNSFLCENCDNEMMEWVGTFRSEFRESILKAFTDKPIIIPKAVCLNCGEEITLEQVED